LTKTHTNILLILSTIILGFSSCISGTWEDEDDNWKRAFNVELPKEIKMKHSWYWRSPHFTFEHQYFFEIEYNDSLEKVFTNANDLVRLDSTQSQNVTSKRRKTNQTSNKQPKNGRQFRCNLTQTDLIFPTLKPTPMVLKIFPTAHFKK
jgi:hypothetical protein